MTVGASLHKIRYWLCMIERACIIILTVAFGLLGFLSPATAASGFSALVVDAHTGKVLFTENPDAPRYPASLTKVMTLYILFEELKAQRMTLNSALKCSFHGASRPPSKLGLRPGDTVSVEDAIKALVTRSANDVAATIAENISGSEKAFAVRMTNKARALGMTRTIFRNASGLPDPGQVTTARDMATLGLRIQRDFPEYYSYFRISSFNYKGRVIRTHNRLIGKYQGTDGIKTGYIRASGFNLTTSVARKGKRLVGVVMGGRTGASRNAYMMKMLDKYFGKATASRVNTIAAVAGTPPGLNSKETVALGQPLTTPEAGSAPLPKSRPSSATAEVEAPPTAPVQKVQETLPATGGEIASLLPESGSSQETAAKGEEEDEAEGEQDWPVPSSGSKHHLSKAQEPLASDSLFKIAAAAAAEAPQEYKRSWQIQIGAYPTKDGAMRIIEKALSLDLSKLTGKTGFAIAITSGSSTLYRARFSGFDQLTAREACKELKQKGVSCLPLAPQG
jgi:D-alanyl-D-alanine carboxypeptidase